MNGKKAKLIRQLIYRREKERLAKEYKQLDNGQVVSSVFDSVYEDAKKECANMTTNQIKEHLKPRKIGGLSNG